MTRTGVGTDAELVEQPGGQLCEAGVGVGRGRAGQGDSGVLGLFAKFVVEVPHHLDVIGDEADRAEHDGLGSDIG